MTDEAELIVTLKKLRYDLTAMQGNVSEALRMAGALDLPDAVRHVCASCGIEARTSHLLEEHVYHSHEGPLPAAWVRIEAMAVEDAA